MSRKSDIDRLYYHVHSHSLSYTIGLKNHRRTICLTIVGTITYKCIFSVISIYRSYYVFNFRFVPFLRYLEAYTITQIIQLSSCLCPVDNFVVFLKYTENCAQITRTPYT